MRYLIILILLITTPAYSSQKTFGDHVVEDDLTVDTDTLYVDSGNNRVGINTDSPSVELDVFGKFNVAASQVTVINRDFVASQLFVDNSTDRVGIGTTSPNALFDVNDIFQVDASQVTVVNHNFKTTGGYLHLGSGVTFQAFYQDEGDIYSEKGKMYLGAGANVRAERYGVGLQIRESNPPATMFYTGATFTASTATIYKAGETFVTDGVIINNFLVISDANDTSYIGSTGEVIGVTETEIIVSIAAAGDAVPDDLTGVAFAILNHPLVSILDNGDTHFKVGISPDASFKIIADDSNNEHAVHFDITSGIDSQAGVDIEYDADSYNNTAAMHINYDATAFSAADDLGFGLDIAVNNTGTSDGDFHAIEVSKGDVTDADMEVEALTTRQGVEPVGQYLSTAATLDAAFSYTPTTYTDRKAAFDDSGTNVQIFTLDDDFILVAAAAKFDVVDVLLNIAASHTIIPTFHYIEDDGDWVLFSPSDETSGFQDNGSIRWSNADLTTWGQRTVREVTAVADDTDYYWIKITRTRSILPTPPTESVISLRTLGSKFYWNKTGDTFTNSVAVVDGITAPTAIVGQAIIYVDISDGDLKCRFGNGFIATIANDS